MLRLEDETPILEEGYPVIVPLLAEEREGDLEIEAYEGIEDIAAEFHARFYAHPFTNAAIDWLDARLRPYVERQGYLRECTGKYRWYITYEADGDSPLCRERILPETRRIEGEDFDVRVSFSLAELVGKGLPVYGTLIEDPGCRPKLVSIATVNEHDAKQRMLEMTVETAPEWRGRGYALSNAVALADDLIRAGYRVCYVASRYNRGSQRIAARAGFSRVGRFYAYTAYKL